MNKVDEQIAKYFPPLHKELANKLKRVFDKSRPDRQAFDWALLTFLIVQIATYWGLFGAWRNLAWPWQEKIATIQPPFAETIWGVNLFGASIALGAIAGWFVYFMVLLRSAKCNALGLRTNSDVDIAESALSECTLPRLNLPQDIAPGNGDKADILDSFIRCSDLAVRHSIRLPQGFTSRDDGLDARPLKFDAIADFPDLLGKYLMGYVLEHRGKFIPNRLSARRTKWFDSRNIDALLEDGRLEDALSLDATLRDLLISLANRFGFKSMAEAGVLIEIQPGRFMANAALLHDAPIFPHYNPQGKPIALSHSLSPILGADCDDLLWDSREIYRAGKDDGVLFITSGIHFAAHLRAHGYHAVAIHPHVWMHPELAWTWPLPRFFSAKLHYDTYSERLRRIERFSNWIVRLCRESNMRRVEFDLSDNFTALTDGESFTHRMMVRFFFRHFVDRHLASGLKASGIEVVSPNPQLWLFLKRIFSRGAQNNSPEHVLDHDAVVDLDGESALFGLSRPVLAPEQVVIEQSPTLSDVPSTPAAPFTKTPIDESSPDSKANDWAFQQSAKGPSAADSAPTAETISGPTSEASRSRAEYYPCKMVQRHDGKWLVAFGSECKTFRNISGVRYVAALFAHPNEYISARDLFEIYSDKFPSPEAWVPAPNEEIPGKGLPLEWRRKPDLILWRKKRFLGLIKREVSLIEDRYTPGEEYEVTNYAGREQMRRLPKIESLLAAAAEREKFTENEITVLTSLSVTDRYVKRVGRNLRYIQDKFKAENMLMLCTYFQDTLEPLEFIRLRFKPDRGVPPGLEWMIEWANKSHIQSRPMAENLSDVSDDPDEADDPDETEVPDEAEDPDEQPRWN